MQRAAVYVRGRPAGGGSRRMPAPRAARPDSCSSGPEPHPNQRNRGRPGDRLPPAAALMSSLSDVHKASGRDHDGRVNVVLGLDASEDAWRRLDNRVNQYPLWREFTGIGSGGTSFRQSMVAAVSAVVGDVRTVSQRQSTGGRWISVTVGPVLVRSADDVVEVYARMRADARLRYFL